MASSTRIVLDSGAVTMLANNNPAFRQYLRREVAAGAYVVIPSSVVAESTCGTARDATVDRVIGSAFIEPMDESIARTAGSLRHRCRLARGRTLDAMVVAVADRLPSSLLITTDPRDLRVLAAEQSSTRVLDARRTSKA